MGTKSTTTTPKACPHATVTVPRAALCALIEYACPAFTLGRLLIGETPHDSHSPVDGYIQDLLGFRIEQIRTSTAKAFVRARAQRANLNEVDPTIEEFLAHLQYLEVGGLR